MLTKIADTHNFEIFVRYFPNRSISWWRASIPRSAQFGYGGSSNEAMNALHERLKKEGLIRVDLGGDNETRVEV